MMHVGEGNGITVCHSVLSLPLTMGVIHGPIACSAVVVSGLLD